VTLHAEKTSACGGCPRADAATTFNGDEFTFSLSFRLSNQNRPIMPL